MTRLVGIAAGMAGAAVIAIAAIAAPQMASAATIPDAITSVSTASGAVAHGDQVTFDCTWTVPDGSRPGDQFTLQLPAQLGWSVSVPTSFTLNSPAPENSPVATASVDAAGLITFTLTDYVLTHPNNVHGTCQFYTVVNYNGGSATTMTLDFGASIVNLPYDPNVHSCSSCGGAPTTANKMMWFSDSTNTVLDAYIYTPATVAAGPVIIEDDPGPGLQVVCPIREANQSSSYYPGNGMPLAPYDSVTPTVDCSPQVVRVTWSNVPAGKFSAIHLKLKVTDASLASYSNTGTVTMNNGQVTPVSAVTVRQGAGGDGQGDVPTPSPQPTDMPSPQSTDAASPSPSTTYAPAAASDDQPHSLATTGGAVPVAAMAAGTALVLVGGAVLIAARRRRNPTK